MQISIKKIASKFTPFLAAVVMLSACSKDGKAPEHANSGKNDSAANSTAVSNDPNASFASKINVNITEKPASFDDKLAYLQGLQMGNQIKMMEINPNIDYFLLGVKHGAEENKTFMTIAELSAMQQEIMKTGSEKMKVIEEKKRKEFIEAGNKAKAEGEAFLAKNKSNANVKTSPSGLQYQILAPGSGEKPTIGDLLLIHLKGTTIDGKELENTFAGEPMPFMLDKNGVPAWREALSMLAPGGKIKVWAPYKLAFGDKGIFPQIPPFSAMIFELQLVDNKGKQAQK